MIVKFQVASVHEMLANVHEMERTTKRAHALSRNSLCVGECWILGWTWLNGEHPNAMYHVND